MRLSATPCYDFLPVLVYGLLALASAGCKHVEMPPPDTTDDYQYTAEILSPTAGMHFRAGDTLLLEVQFRSGTDEIVHNVHVRIQALEMPEISFYSVQSHVHRTGSYRYRDQLVLQDTALIRQYPDWRCIASVWSHAPDAEISSDSLQIRLLP